MILDSTPSYQRPTSLVNRCGYLGVCHADTDLNALDELPFQNEVPPVGNAVPCRVSRYEVVAVLPRFPERRQHRQLCEERD